MDDGAERDSTGAERGALTAGAGPAGAERRVYEGAAAVGADRCPPLEGAGLGRGV